MENFFAFFSNSGFMPHIHCYLSKPPLVWTMLVTDTLIGVSYFSISLTLWALVKKIKIPFSFVVLCFGIFIAACGGTHFMEIYNLWVPNYWLAAGVKIVTALASVGTGIYLYQLRHPLVLVAEAAKLSEQRRLDLESLTKTLEHRVEERTKELQKAVTIRDDFFSIASHELRTPLTSVRMKTQMAKRGIGLKAQDEESKKFLTDMDEQVERLTRLVDDMLDISRFRGGKLQLVLKTENLSEIVHSTAERFRHQFVAAYTQLNLEIEPNIKLSIDKLRIEQVLSNLFINAIKYASGAPLFVKVKATGSHAQIVVKDSGPGIAIEDQERIFQKFERLDSALDVSGLGVGLYLSRALVEAHEGTLNIHSEKGKGAEFFIKLPL